MGAGRSVGDDWAPRERAFHGPLTQAQVDAVLQKLRGRFDGELERGDATPTDAQLVEILHQIHVQLEPEVADELVFYASDDPILFSASVLSKARDGALDLPPELVHLLNTVLRGTS